MLIPDFRMPQVESTLDYTKARDLHSVGIILLQMSVGKDLMKRFPDPPSVFHLRVSPLQPPWGYADGLL